MALTRGDKNLADAPYLLTNADGQKTLQQKWVVEGGLSVAQVKANIVPELFARYNALGWTDNEVMLMTLLPAYWNDWVIKGNGGGQPINGIITSNNGVTVPAGVYLVNYPCITDGGEYYGAGTGFSGAPGGLVSMSTNLVYDRVGWIGGLGGTHLDGTYTSGGATVNIIFDQANLIQTTTWQVASGARSYTESGYIDGFRLTGDNGGWYNVAQRRSNGMGLWDAGETSFVGRIFAETFNGSGVVLVRGTPATINMLSSFQNAWSGIEFVGTDLSTININTLSGDDNPCMIGTAAGYGRVNSAIVNVNLIKSETGKRTPNKGQVILWERDASYMKLHIGAVQGNVAGLYIDAYFVVNNAANGRKMISVDCFEGNNFRTLLHDVTGGKRWAGTAYRPESCVYSFRNNVSRLQDAATSTELVSSSVNASDRLGMVPVNGIFDYTTGTPVYDIYGGGTPPPPPPACAWVTGPWSAWSACVNGQQSRTRTVTSSVPGCTPPDPAPPSTETQACGTPPPAAPPIYTRSPFNNTNPSATIDLNPDVVGVKRIVLTNVSFNVSAFAYQRLLVQPGGTSGLRAEPLTSAATTCRFKMPNGQYATSNVPTIQAGLAYPSLVLTLPVTMNVDRLLAPAGTGGAMLLTCDRIDLYDY